MNRLFIILLLASLVLTGCGQATPDKNAINTAIVQAEAARPSNTPQPTLTPVPPSPTIERSPTSTSTSTLLLPELSLPIEDDFSDEESGWTTASHEVYTMGYGDGK